VDAKGQEMTLYGANFADANGVRLLYGWSLLLFCSAAKLNDAHLTAGPVFLPYLRHTASEHGIHAEHHHWRLAVRDCHAWWLCVRPHHMSKCGGRRGA
jgi:hypothetical protein